MHKIKKKMIEPGCKVSQVKFGAKRLHKDWDAMKQSWKSNIRNG